MGVAFIQFALLAAEHKGEAGGFGAVLLHQTHKFPPPCTFRLSLAALEHVKKLNCAVCCTFEQLMGVKDPEVEEEGLRRGMGVCCMQAPDLGRAPLQEHHFPKKHLRLRSLKSKARHLKAGELWSS